MITTAKPPADGCQVTLAGNLTRDPELRFSTKGTPWCSVGLAVNPTRRLDDGTYEELPAEFYELTTFGDLAEHLAESLGKGDRVLATGRVEVDTWTGRDGEERTTAKLVCEEVGPSLRFATVEVRRTGRRAPTEPADDADDGEPF